MRYFIIIILYFFPLKIVAQNLAFNDLKNILSKSIVESSDYLENKGYRIFNTKSNTDDNQLSYIWDKNGNPNQTVSYLLITWDKTKKYKMVWYQFHSLYQFKSLKTNLEKQGFKLVDNYVKFESLYYEYKSPYYSISMSKGEVSYTFSIKYNSDRIKNKDIFLLY
jgi:hypothetical protein